MNKFIKVTANCDNIPIYVNASKIIAIYVDDDGITSINVENDGEYCCKETPEEVFNLLKD